MAQMARQWTQDWKVVVLKPPGEARKSENYTILFSVGYFGTFEIASKNSMYCCEFNW